jgi:hypothetical protein
MFEKLSQVMGKLPNFVTHDQGNGTMKYGKEALVCILEALSDQSGQEDSQHSLEDIEPLQLYSYSLTPNQQEQVAELVNKVLGASASFRQAASSSSCTGQSKKRKVSELEDAAAGLFD